MPSAASHAPTTVPAAPIGTTLAAASGTAPIRPTVHAALTSALRAALDASFSSAI